MEEKKIFGLYPGSLDDNEYVKTCPEQTLYFLIRSLGGLIWIMRHEENNEKGENICFSEEQYAIEFCIYQTKRFGVEVSEPAENKHIKYTRSYFNWSKKWSTYFKNDKYGKELYEYKELSKKGKNIPLSRLITNMKEKSLA